MVFAIPKFATAYSGASISLITSLVRHHVRGVRSNLPPRRARIYAPLSAVAQV